MLALAKLAFAGLLAVTATMLQANAEDNPPTFEVHFSNGIVSPSVLEVPANVRFKLELHNDGSAAIEFESTELRKEKVLAPGANSFLIFRSLEKGDYAFFDDFHTEMPPARIMAR
jgi:hypothetical protein